MVKWFVQVDQVVPKVDQVVVQVDQVVFGFPGGAPSGYSLGRHWWSPFWSRFSPDFFSLQFWGFLVNSERHPSWHPSSPVFSPVFRYGTYSVRLLKTNKNIAVAPAEKHFFKNPAEKWVPYRLAC